MEAQTNEDKVHAASCHAFFKLECDSILKRAKKWFDMNPCEAYCYWSKHDFIHVADKHNKKVLEANPEIEDINDHTIVSIRGDMYMFTEFCPKLKRAVGALYRSGVTSGETDYAVWNITECGDNYKITAVCK